jgi:hypothetical protein
MNTPQPKKPPPPPETPQPSGGSDEFADEAGPKDTEFKDGKDAHHLISGEFDPVP